MTLEQALRLAYARAPWAVGWDAAHVLAVVEEADARCVPHNVLREMAVISTDIILAGGMLHPKDKRPFRRKTQE